MAFLYQKLQYQRIKALNIIGMFPREYVEHNKFKPWQYIDIGISNHMNE